MLAKRVSELSSSQTLALNARAKSMASEGIDVVNLTAGEPDFDTPEAIREAGINAIRSGKTRYTPVSGLPELKKAIIRKHDDENGISYSQDEVIVSCGAKHSLYNIFQSLCEPGDEVVLPCPLWNSYSEQVKLSGAKPVYVDTSADGFVLKADRVAGAITGRTKIVLLNSPSNPTGAVVCEKDIRAIASLVSEKDIMLVSDEIYEHMIYEGKHFSPASIDDDIKARTITVNGVSKSFFMTGWRIGWACGPADVVKAMEKLQSHSTSNPSSISQYASIEALSGSVDTKPMMKEFRNRRDLIMKLMNGAGISCVKPGGAFYVFPDISPFIGRDIRDSSDFSMKLLSEKKVAVVPGSAFGSDANIRISYACSRDDIKKGMERISGFVSGLK